MRVLHTSCGRNPLIALVNDAGLESLARHVTHKSGAHTVHELVTDRGVARAERKECEANQALT